MIRWEYRTVLMSCPSQDGELDSELDALGADRWELVTMCGYSAPHYALAVFKRPVRDARNDPVAQHPGVLLRNSRTELEISLRSAAKMLGITYVELGNAERGVMEWKDAAILYDRWLKLQALASSGDDSDGTSNHKATER